MKSIVIYKSSTGFTQKYAEWIAETLSSEAVSAENAKTLDLGNYDAVIFGGWFLAGKIQGLSDYKQKLFAFHGKKAVFAVGAMPTNVPKAADALSACFSEEERKHIGTFYMQGGLKYDKMGFIHKTMMKMMCSIMKKQHGADSEEYKRISHSFDGTERAAIEPLIEYIS